jgi:hypothetical protein
VNGEEQSDQYVQAETKNRHDFSQVANYFLWAPGPLTYWIDSLLAEGEYVYWARLYIRMAWGVPSIWARQKVSYASPF